VPPFSSLFWQCDPCQARQERQVAKSAKDLLLAVRYGGRQGAKVYFEGVLDADPDNSWRPGVLAALIPEFLPLVLQIDLLFREKNQQTPGNA
jgi:hypothetical protein